MNLPLISLTLALRSGMTSDPEGQDGVLRLMLRLLRRGSRGKSAHEIDAQLDRLGAEVAIEVGPSSATLHAQVLSRNVDAFIALLAELLAEPSFDADEMERLRRESLAELQEARDSDRSLCNLWFRRSVFAGDRYARSAAGTLASLRALTLDDVRAAYKHHLRRGQIITGFCGDVSVEQAIDLHTRLLSGLPEGAPEPLDLPEPRGPIGRSLVFVDKPERSQTQVLLGRLGTHPRDDDHLALSLANTAFGGTFTARLMQEIRAKRGWSYGASSRLSIDRRRHAFSIWTFPAAEQVAGCLALELQLWRDFWERGISQRELGFYRNYLARSYAFEIDTAHKRVSQAIDVDLLDLPSDYYSGYLDKLASITLDQANAAVRARLDPSSMVAVVVGTEALSYQSVQDALAPLDSSRVVPFDAD